MTKAGRERIRQDFLQKTGIDLETYRNPEIVETLVELLGFPKMVWRFVGKPVLIGMLVVACLAPLADGMAATVAWLGFGGVLGVLLGLLVGAWLLSLFLTQRLEGLITVVLGVVAAVWKDAGELRHRYSEKRLVMPSIPETIRAVAEVVVIPQVTESLVKGVFLIGPLLRKPVEWICGKVIRQMMKFERKAEAEEAAREVWVEEVVEGAGMLEQVSEAIIASSGVILGGVQRFVTVPILLGGAGVIGLIALLAWWLW